ncbi:unnamed protein product [Sphagnum jensenii]|uniref:Uncharacterized protein n=1 Tax=Sphagnum jensenii TaxID=128206 RepID=A0ABP0VR16_9BRYO
MSAAAAAAGDPNYNIVPALAEQILYSLESVRGKGRSERTQELLSLKQQLLVQMIHLVHSLLHYFPSVDHPADYSVEPEIYCL